MPGIARSSGATSGPDRSDPKRSHAPARETGRSFSRPPSRFTNPVWYLCDFAAIQRGELQVVHRIPHSDIASLSDEELARLTGQDEPLEFDHTLDDLIAG